MGSYKIDMEKAARRHSIAAERLYGSDRQDVAGYLFGIAAECAFKQLMRLSGIPIQSIEKRREDPYYAHFEDLKGLALDRLSGRNAGRLRAFCERSDFMQYWDVSMRYSDGRDIENAQVAKWRNNAAEILAAMECG
jgi:hypothetical protein